MGMRVSVYSLMPLVHPLAPSTGAQTAGKFKPANEKPGGMGGLLDRIRFHKTSSPTSTPHFHNPGTNVSNVRLNEDGAAGLPGGRTAVTGAADGEPQFRLGLRRSF